MATMQKVLIDFEARIANAEKNINKISKDVKNVGDSAQQSTKGMDNATKSATKFFGKLVAAAAVLRKMYTATRDNIQATAKLNAVIKATGGVSGITTGNVGKLIKELQDYSGTTEASAKNTTALLLTFRNISKNEMPATIKATADLAATMGVDMKSAAIQVGKALNDPLTGLTSLTRSGITFSEEQKTLIKGFVSTNQLAKAQGIILQELQTQFGGAAQAMNNTPIGKIETAFSKLTDALAKIGQAVIPVFADIVGAVGDFIEMIVNASPAIRVLAAAVSVLIGALTGPIGLIIGLVTAVGLLKSAAINVDELASKSKELGKQFNIVAKTQKLVNGLNGLKKGTKDYNKQIDTILKINPELAKSNKVVGKSYEEIGDAISQLADKQSAFFKAQAQFNYTKITDELKVVVARFQGASSGVIDLDFLVKKTLTDLAEKGVGSIAKLGSSIASLGIFAGKSKKEIETYRDAVVAGLKKIGTVSGVTGAQFAKVFSDSFEKARKTASDQMNGIAKDTDRARRKIQTRTGGGGGAISFFDISKAQADDAVDRATGLSKQLLSIRNKYEDDIDKIRKARFKNNFDRAIANDLAEDKFKRKTEQATTKWLEKEEKKRADKAKQNAEDLANYRREQLEATTQAVETTTEIIGDLAEMNIMGALRKGLSAAGPWGEFANAGIAAAQTIIGIFSSESESQIEKMKKRFNEIVDIVESVSGITTTVESFLGGATEKTIESSLSLAETTVNQMAKILGINIEEMTREELNAFIEQRTKLINLNAEFQSATSAYVNAFKQGLSGESLQPFRDEMNSIIQEIGDAMGWEVGTFFRESEGTTYLNFVENVQAKWREFNYVSGITADEFRALVESLEKIDDLTIKSKLLENQEELKDIQDDIRTGQVEELETLQQQIDIYQEMIESLEGVAGAGDVVTDLMAEQWDLQQKLNAAMLDGADIAKYTQDTIQGQQLQGLIDLYAQLERQITTGALREGAAETVSQQVAILDSIISNLQAQGADTSIIADYEEQRANLLKSLYGDVGFAARSGTGQAVGFDVPGIAYSAPVVQTAGTSTTTENSNNVITFNISDGTTADNITAEQIADAVFQGTGIDLFELARRGA